MNKIKVGVLGATGAVGQRFVQLLENHPYFEVSSLAASEKSANKTYYEIMRDKWFVSSEIPDYAKEIIVEGCDQNLKCRLVFSALDSSVAGEIESKFAEKGYIVSSNSKNHRMNENVPLLIPEINSEHLELIKNKKGFIVTNPNCSTIGLILALAPLHKKFGIKKIFVTTMQALSGAGYPGVSSLDILEMLFHIFQGKRKKWRQNH